MALILELTMSAKREKMVRLIIQEMEDTLVEVRSTSAKTLAEKKELVRRVDTLKAQVNDWQDKAELALSKDRDDLARSALLEKQKSADAVAAVESELDHVESHIEKLQQEVTTLQEKLADANSSSIFSFFCKSAISSANVCLPKS